MPPSIQRLVADHWEKGLLLIFPTVLWWSYPLWIVDKTDLDVWFYYGYFRHFFEFWNYFSIDEAHKYYGTRVPYIGLGHIFWHFLNPDAARYAFHALFLYPVIILCFWYVARVHTSRGVAFAAASMMGTDIFFIRDAGSDYVNTGVLLYQMLAFVCLARAVKSVHRNLYLILAGFCAASMVFTHLVALVYLPLLVLYYLFFVTRQEPVRFIKLLGPTLSYGIGGVIVAFVVWAGVFYYGTHDTTFFLKPQILMLFLDHASSWALSFGSLGTSSYWVTIHWAALFGASMAVVWMCVNRKMPEPDIFFWIVIGPLFCGLLAIFKLDGLLLLYSRDGLYATPLFALTYLTIAALLFHKKSLNMWAALGVFTVCVISLWIRLAIGSVELPVWAVAALIGVLCFLAFFFEEMARRWMALGLALLVGVATLLIPHEFDGRPIIYPIHEYIVEKAQGRLPKIFWSEETRAEKRVGDTYFVSIESSFTERAHWQRGMDFPNCAQPDGGGLAAGDLVVILSTQPVGDDELARFQEKCVGDLRKAESRVFEDAKGKYYVQFLEVPLHGRLVAWNRDAKELPGLVGHVDGADRVADDGKDKEGFLTYGPYAQILPGHYKVTLWYASDTDDNWWDSTELRDNQIVVTSKGGLPNTHGQMRKLELDFVRAESVKNFELRTYFAGKGRMSVHRAAMVSFPDPN
ncbi:MAG TPA: hypothetical protein VGC69_02305 [Bordetella sp.]